MKKKGNKIGWCDKTSNPVWGCPKNCSFGCYARTINDRFKRIPDFSKPQFFPNALKEFRTKEPMIIFIDSMSDIGYWKDDWLTETFCQMTNNPQNKYLALTKKYVSLTKLRYKRHEINTYTRAKFYIGATVTNNAQAQAVIDAGGADFISFEPLLERIEPELLEKLKCMWWIVGDLTKNGKPQGVTRKAWVCGILADATLDSIPVFMKDSIRRIMGVNYKQEFPEGWKS
jgi:protein gp37